MSKRCLLVAWIILAAHALSLGARATVQFPLPTELVRLTAGCEHWHEGTFGANIGNPLTVDMIASAPLAWWGERRAVWRLRFREVDIDDLFPFIVLGRCLLVPVSVLGAWVCFAWSKALYGPSAGYLSLVLWCTDPLLLSHGALLTGDMVAAALGVNACYRLWLFDRRRTVPGALIAGVSLGAAMVSKYLWLFAPPVMLVQWWLWRSSPPQPGRRGNANALCAVAVIAITALLVVNVAFGFEGSFQNVSDFELRSAFLHKLEKLLHICEDVPGCEWIGRVPVPVPRNYINGIDALVNYRATVESVSYINGTFYADGLWYFYLYALAVKMPAGTLLLFAAALVRALRCRTVSTVVAQLALLLPALAVMCIVSCCTSVQQVRYIIPILPFVFVAIGNVVEARSEE